MILPMLLFFKSTFDNQLIEALPGNSVSSVAADIVIHFPKGGPLDDAIEDVLADIVRRDTKDYGEEEVKELTRNGGQQLEVEALPVGIHIWFKLATTDASSLVPLITNLVEFPTISQASLDASRSYLLSKKPTREDEVFKPYDLPYGDIRVYDVQQAFIRQFRPDQIAITLKVPAKYAGLANELKQKLAGITPVQPNRWYPDPLPYKFRKGKPNVIPVVLKGQPVGLTSTTFGSQLLAMMVLGGGKGSILWQKIRDKNRWSYLQEADYYSSSQGLTPYLFFFNGLNDRNLEEKGGSFQMELNSSVDNLTKQDLTRAIAFSKSTFLLGYGMNPFHATTQAPDLGLFLDNVWRLSGSTDPNWSFIVKAMSSITLDELKRAAHQIIDKSDLQLLSR